MEGKIHIYVYINICIYIIWMFRKQQQKYSSSSLLFVQILECCPITPPVICTTVHPVMRWYSVWDLTLFWCIHTLASCSRTFIYSLLPCWWTDEYVWVKLPGCTLGRAPRMTSTSSVFISVTPSTIFSLAVPQSILLFPWCSLCLSLSLKVFCQWVCQLFFIFEKKLNACEALTL